MFLGSGLSIVPAACQAQSWILSSQAPSAQNGSKTSSPLFNSSTTTQAPQVISSVNSCNTDKIQFDPLKHKQTYTVAVHAIAGLDAALAQSNIIFGEYLTKTAGKKFNPPIEFNVVAHLYGDLFDAITNGEVDFFYANSGIYSCIGTEVGAAALGTVVKCYDIRGQHYDLDLFGGVIAVRKDNDAINKITDLKDKIVGAGGITNIMGGQMQIYEMQKAGMSYVNDPKQVVFTNDQQQVVLGVLDGTFDAGFVRTEQIEISKDADGNPVDPDLFKIIETKVFVMDSGELFPFLHSTDIIPEWPLAVLSGVHEDVKLAVEDALMDYGDFVHLGQLDECEAGLLDTDECKDLKLQTVTRTLCDVTNDIITTAVQASRDSRIASFEPSSSYFVLRSKLQEAGFMYQEGNGWKCLRPDKLYDGITCPSGFFKRDETEFSDGCQRIGLGCNDHQGWTCFCKPCVKAFEVDIYHHEDGEVDHHLEEYFGAALQGCAKMDICGVTEQRKSIKMRIFDNAQRDGANVTVTVHAGATTETIFPKQVHNTYAYDFTISDNQARVQVLDILVNGQPISQSPVRVMVVEADCDATYGENSNRLPDSEGNCVCAGNTYDILGSCIESAAFFVIIFSAIIVAIGIILFFYLGYKKKQSDSVWHINVEELHFNEPPEVIGAGGFGVVILGVYRGTKVAVKRVLPPVKMTTGGSSGLQPSESQNDVIECEGIGHGSEKLDSHQTTKKKDSKSKHHNNKSSVQFGSSTNSTDIESQQAMGTTYSVLMQTQTQMQAQGSVSGSNKDWEKLMAFHHSNNDIIKLLESATSSDHGTGSMFDGSDSKHHVLKRFLPMWLRFDAHSRRVNEFVNEMRLLSRLRHPCITTVMGAVISSTVDPMLGKSRSDVPLVTILTAI